MWQGGVTATRQDPNDLQGGVTATRRDPSDWQGGVTATRQDPNDWQGGVTATRHDPNDCGTTIAAHEKGLQPSPWRAAQFKALSLSQKQTLLTARMASFTYWPCSQNGNSLARSYSCPSTCMNCISQSGSREILAMPFGSTALRLARPCKKGGLGTHVRTPCWAR